MLIHLRALKHQTRHLLFLNLPRLQTLNPASLPLPRSISSEVGNGGQETCGKQEATEWTDNILYLDESGGVICSGPGLRPTDPGSDSHVMVGDLRKPLSASSAAAKIVEIARRWRWGPDLHSNLDRLPFIPSPSILQIALSNLLDAESSLSLLQWARRQSWFSSSDDSYSILLDRLYSAGDIESVISLFEEIISDGEASFPASLNRAIQYIAHAGRMEVSFHCFKKLRDISFSGFTTQTYNSLITIFLTKGLPYITGWAETTRKYSQLPVKFMCINFLRKYRCTSSPYAPSPLAKRRFGHQQSQPHRTIPLHLSGRIALGHLADAHRSDCASPERLAPIFWTSLFNRTDNQRIIRAHQSSHKAPDRSDRHKSSPPVDRSDHHQNTSRPVRPIRPSVHHQSTS